MVVIIAARLAILTSLLSEADFFVDGKDLQTFVSATFQSRFFLCIEFQGSRSGSFFPGIDLRPSRVRLYRIDQIFGQRS